VDIMARKVQADETLENDAPSWKRAGKEYEEARSCAAIDHHIEDCSELCELLELPCCDAVRSVEETGYSVEKGACSRMERHVVEGGFHEDDSSIS
jgi:hypothetical protein